MAKFKLLQDLYRFPGFVPLPGLRGVFGDPRAVVITLRRRRKKRFAAFADECLEATTTSDGDVPAISRAATNASISPTLCAGSNARGVGA
jgi:hypothetical protein